MKCQNTYCNNIDYLKYNYNEYRCALCHSYFTVNSDNKIDKYKFNYGSMLMRTIDEKLDSTICKSITEFYDIFELLRYGKALTFPLIEFELNDDLTEQIINKFNMFKAFE